MKMWVNSSSRVHLCFWFCYRGLFKFNPVHPAVTHILLLLAAHKMTRQRWNFHKKKQILYYSQDDLSNEFSLGLSTFCLPLCLWWVNPYKKIFWKMIYYKNTLSSKPLMGPKFWQIGVPTQNLLSSRVLKVCNLGQVEAQNWKPKIVFSWSMNTSPVRTRSYNPQFGLVFVPK